METSLKEPAEISPEALEEAHHLGEKNLNPRGIGLWALLREDLATHEGDLFSQGFWAIAVHRYGNWRMDIRPKVVRAPFSFFYRVLYKIVEWTCGISISYATPVGRRVHLWHHGGMILSARRIGSDVHIRQNTTFGVAHEGDHVALRPVIEDGADIGVGAVIIGAVRVGKNAKIGANAVVIRDVPDNAVAVGVPAKVIKTLQGAGKHEARSTKFETEGKSEAPNPKLEMAPTLPSPGVPGEGESPR